jgi:hypothetical protein
MWNGTTYTTSGVYTFAYTNAAGCASVDTLNLTINNNSAITTINQSVTTTNFTLPWGLVVTNDGSYSNNYLNINGCDSTVVYNISFNNFLFLSAKVFLSGCYDSISGLMHDSLRSKNLIPLTEPYSSAPYNLYFNTVNSGGEVTTLPIFTATGTDAIVDWVFIELRSKNDSTIVVATRSALLQRDGDVVDVDGISAVKFNGINIDDYFIAIKHRNHLGVMTKFKQLISSAGTNIDFTSLSTPLHQFAGKNGNPSPLTGAAKIITNKRALYAGNANLNIGLNANKFITYTSFSNSDRTSLFNAAGPSGTINGYSVFDVDLNGFARFNGLNPDRLVILNTCINSNSIIVKEQIP